MNLASQIVADEILRTGLTLDELRSPRRDRRIAWPRQEIMRRLYDQTNMSLGAIGRFFNRDHTTVLKGIQAAEARVDKHLDISAAEIEQLISDQQGNNQ